MCHGTTGAKNTPNGLISSFPGCMTVSAKNSMTDEYAIMLMNNDVYLWSTSTMSWVRSTTSHMVRTRRNFSRAYSIKQTGPGYVRTMITEITEAADIENVSHMYLTRLVSDTGSCAYA